MTRLCCGETVLSLAAKMASQAAEIERKDREIVPVSHADDKTLDRRGDKDAAVNRAREEQRPSQCSHARIHCLIAFSDFRAHCPRIALEKSSNSLVERPSISHEPVLEFAPAPGRLKSCSRAATSRAGSRGISRAERSRPAHRVQRDGPSSGKNRRGRTCLAGRPVMRSTGNFLMREVLIPMRAAGAIAKQTRRRKSALRAARRVFFARA